MNREGITNEMVYLCIGDDLEKIASTQIYARYFQGIKYYTVGQFSLIEGEAQIFCSCNENYCWHIFKLVLDGKKAIDSQSS
jgi:hypothetical protein